jgi:hypothetical protein
MSQQTFTVITVILADRETGGLRAYSDDLPGLILSGRDRDDVFGKIAPAIEALFRHKGFNRVRVTPARPVAELMNADRSRDVHTYVQHEQFVIELATAA